MKKVLFARACLIVCFCLFLAFLGAFLAVQSKEAAHAADPVPDLVIENEEGMAAFALASRTSTFNNQIVSLNADLTLPSDFPGIGVSSCYFEGTFLGNGHTVTLSTSAAGSASATGLFAYTGTNSRIDGVVTSGSVTGNNYVGGIVGRANGGVISRCVSFADVDGMAHVGGIAGYCSGTITQCLCFSDINARSTIGGAVGYLQSGASLIEDTAYFGEINVKSGGTVFGGLVGNSEGSLKNTYTFATFSGSVSVVHGSVIGTLTSVGSGISYSYGIDADRSAVGSNSSGQRPETLTTKTSYELLSGAVVFSGDTKLSVAAFDVGFGFYPCPSFMLTTDRSDFVEPYRTVCRDRLCSCLFSSGIGSELDPFIVSAAEDWKLFITNSHLYDYTGVYIELSDSITLGSVSGAGSTDLPFAGAVNGNDHSITFSSTQGLFACIGGATINNIKVKGEVAGGSDLGIVVSFAKTTDPSVISHVIVIKDSFVSGSDRVGSILGGTSVDAIVTIDHCNSYATVQGSNYVGGLIGRGQGNVTCSASYNGGEVGSSNNGGQYVGGIFGSIEGVVTLSGLSDEGRVLASKCTAVGGIGGSVSATNALNASSVCAAASVQGRYNVGGLFGQLSGNIVISSSAYLGTVKGGNFLGGLVGKLPAGSSEETLTVRNSYFTGSFERDRTVSLTTNYEAFCVASPTIEESLLTSVSGLYEYNATTGAFSLTGDMIAQGGKKYYDLLSSVTLENVYYNSDVYFGVNTNGATGRNTVELSNGRSVFPAADAESWLDEEATYQYGFYPIPASFWGADSASFATEGWGEFLVYYFEGGEGTEASPLRIGTERQLRNFGNLFNEFSGRLTGKYFRQTADIVLARPLFVITEFHGVYDGNNKLISSLTIESSDPNVGFFGSAYGTLKNICIDGGNVVATGSLVENVGGLAAVCFATVENCFAHLTLTAPTQVSPAEPGSENVVVGGLLGKSNASVASSFFIGTVTGGRTVGGLIGSYSVGIVSECFTSGKIEGRWTVGGLIGVNNGGQLTSSMTNCVLYMTEECTSAAIVGGLVGVNNVPAVNPTSVSAKVTSCLSNARIIYAFDTSSITITGGPLAGTDASNRLDNSGDEGVSCYYNVDYAPQFNAPGDSSKKDSEYILRTTTVANVTSRVLSVTGLVDTGLTYYNQVNDARYSFRPEGIVTWAQNNYQVDLYSKIAAEMVLWEYDYTVMDEYARGSEQNPYRIDNALKLQRLSFAVETTHYSYVNKYFVLTANLDMGDVSDFYPIGFYKNYDESYPFSGVVDGCGHTISNLYLDFYSFADLLGREESENRYVALFGYTGPEFVLKRLVLDDTCRIYGGTYSASFVGFFQGRIEECLSYAKITAIATVTSLTGSELTADDYQPDTYYYKLSAVGGGYELAQGAFNSTIVYYDLSTNIGGFVGNLASAGNVISKCFFSGSLSARSEAYGFVGLRGNFIQLTTDDSWYLTQNSSYAFEESYGRVIVDYADATNGGVVTIVNDWSGSGFGVRLVAAEKYYPFIYNANLDPLSLSATYYLLSDSAVRYQIRYCQKVVLNVTAYDKDGAELSDPATYVSVTGDRRIVTLGVTEYYYYDGQPGSITYTWRVNGYYLDALSEDGHSDRGSFHNEGDYVVYDFTMDRTTENEYVIAATVRQIDYMLEFGSGDSVTYDGNVHEVTVTANSGYTTDVVYYNSLGRESSLLNAGTYTVKAYLVKDDVRVGIRSKAFTIDPIVLNVKTTAQLTPYATKEYDGVTYKRVDLSSAALFDGILNTDIPTYGVSETKWYATALVTWASADSGEDISYTVSEFAVVGTNNYSFAPSYILQDEPGQSRFTDGVITKKRIFVAISSAIETDFNGEPIMLYTGMYEGRRPQVPFESAYDIVWSYYQGTVDQSGSITFGTTPTGVYNVGYYKSVPSLNEETAKNYTVELSGKTYCINILPLVVTTVNFQYNTLWYTGSDLSSDVSTYFAGVGEDGETIRASVSYYMQAAPIESAFIAGDYFVKNAAQTHFIPASGSFDETAQYYVLSSGLVNAGTYYVDCYSTSDNYKLERAIYDIVVNKAESDYDLTFTLDPSGTSVYYNTPIRIEFTDALSLTAGYDASYRVEYIDRSNGGRLECVKRGDDWYVLPTAYGSNIVFTLVSYGASNYQNRTAPASITLTVLPIELKVGIANKEQTFGDVIDFTLEYYYMDGPDKVVIPASSIAGLNAPVVTTGASLPDHAGEYGLIYNGGSSSGYVFDTTVTPTLTVNKRQVYVSVPSELGNTKVYGDKDPEMKYNVYADEDCTILMELLPNGEELGLVGAPSRTQGENVGSYDINAGSLADPTKNGNYTVTYVAGSGKFVIMYRDIYLRVKEGQGKYYGDEDQPYELEVMEGYSLAKGDYVSSFMYGVNPSVIVSRELGETVGEYEYVVEIDHIAAGRGNYTILGVDVSSYYRIVRAKPMISFTFEGEVHYGDNTDDMSCASARAYIDNRTVAGTFSWTRKVFDNMNVTRVELVFTPSDTANYNSASMSIVVAPKKRVVYPVFSGATVYTYSGSAHSALTVSVTGAVEGNNNYSIATSVSGDNVNVSDAGFVFIARIASDYYTFEDGDEAFVNCIVAPAVVTVRVENTAVTYGSAYEPTIKYTGFVNGETERVLTRSATVDSIPTESGVYSLMPSGAEARNYIFSYQSGILTINKLSAEGEGITVSGVFAPGVSVEMSAFTEGAAFEDMQSTYDKKFGAHYFVPIKIQMTSYYSVHFVGETDDDEMYGYSVELEKDIPEGARIYLCSSTGELSLLDNYEIEDGKIIFVAGPISSLFVYEEKDQQTYLKGFIPLALVAGGFVLLIMTIGVITYFRRHSSGRRGKSVYRAERATYKAFPHRK